jgi:hypothetical protein
MPTIVLLLAPEAAGIAAANALRRALDAEVDLHSTAQAGTSALRHRSYTLVLLDETIAPRIVRQARAALVRRTRDIALAQTAAASLLHNELNQTLSGLLLESELALRHATPEQEPRLREVVQMAQSLRDRLRA